MGICKREHTDPKMPKRPISAYIMYYSETLKTLGSKQPDSPVSEIAKTCAKQWRKMTASQRNKYLTRARMGNKLCDLHDILKLWSDLKIAGLTKYRTRMSRYR
jgi:hypothetical protein